jgi:hypothetical protein
MLGLVIGIFPINQFFSSIATGKLLSKYGGHQYILLIGYFMLIC